MFLPVEFDTNEIYILLVGFLVTLLFLGLPNRFSRVEVTLILGLNFYLVSLIDQVLAGEIFNFYDIMDVPEFEVIDFFIYIFVYPFCGYLFLYIYQGVRRKLVIPYVLLAVVITLGLEGLSIVFGVFHYNNWSIVFSGIAYTIVYTINILFWHLVENVYGKKDINR